MRNLFIFATVILTIPQWSWAQSTVVATTEMETVRPEDVGMSSDKLAKVVPAMQQMVDDGFIPGAIVMVAKDGRIVLHESVGLRRFEPDVEMEKDSILRFYSMTKPITSVCIMMLVEEGKLRLDDPVATVIPEFKGLKVFDEEVDGELKTMEAERAMTIRDLLRHTSGLSYGFFGDTAVDRAYASVDIISRREPLQSMIDKLAKLPLLYQPGVRFNYSVSTDVLGLVIERVSGQSLNDFFQQRVFDPLDMGDTAFHVPADKTNRFADVFGSRQTVQEVKPIESASDSLYLEPPALYSGGGGLVSTARDYMRFCQMLLNRGEFGGKRLLKEKTVDKMTKNQLPENAYPLSLGEPRPGVGFGFGFSVVVESTEWTKRCRIGEYGWGGAASTHFWISPDDDLAVVALTQFKPFSFQLENLVKPIVYDAIDRKMIDSK